MISLSLDKMDALVLEVALRRYERNMRSFLSDNERLKINSLLEKVNKVIQDEVLRS